MQKEDKKTDSKTSCTDGSQRRAASERWWDGNAEQAQEHLLFTLMKLESQVWPTWSPHGWMTVSNSNGVMCWALHPPWATDFSAVTLCALYKSPSDETVNLSLAGAATSIIVKCACHDKSFVTTKYMLRQTHVCCNKSFVATSILLSQQKTCFVMTKLYLLLQYFVIFCRYKNYTCGSSRQW